jgi:hypothetical protein
MLPQQADGPIDLDFSWRVLRKMLHEPDPRFVGYRANGRAERAFRLVRFRIYWQALAVAREEVSQRFQDAIEERGRQQAAWDFPELMRRDFRIRIAFLRLRWAGVLFVLHSERAASQFDRAQASLTFATAC